jgi:hypothetical protein
MGSITVLTYFQSLWLTMIIYQNLNQNLNVEVGLNTMFTNQFQTPFF